MRHACLPMGRAAKGREGVVTSWPVTVCCERMKGAEAAGAAATRRTVDWLVVAGQSACAGITMAHGATTFTDYFVLLKTADGWKIANKAFHGRPS